MKIGIIGLGLIGGSIAKAIKEHTEHTVFGYDCKETVLRKAILLEVVDEPLTDEDLADCDILLLALYPGTTVEVLRERAPRIGKETIVVDCSGVKEAVCCEAEAIAGKNGFVFVGGHPMAGVEFSGFEHSQKGLFRNASMILTPPKGTDIRIVEKLKRFFLSLGFGNVEITTPGIHDKMIAYTSQLAHLVSSAYIKSPTAAGHRGFSAGSYRDMTRVAKLDPDMWTELFLKNRDNLLEELDGLLRQLEQYRAALAGCRRDDLWDLLSEGNKRKIELDSRSRSPR